MLYQDSPEAMQMSAYEIVTINGFYSQRRDTGDPSPCRSDELCHRNACFPALQSRGAAGDRGRLGYGLAEVR